MSEQYEYMQDRVTGDASVATFSNAVLMIINAQNEYLDGSFAIPGIGAAIDEISQLLARARRNETPIMYLQHVDRPGGLFDTVGYGGGFIEAIAPDNNEYVLQKTMPNGFAASNLNDQLAHIGRRNLIMTGFMTHMCVSFTARAAQELGYNPTVVGNACAASALPEPAGFAGDDWDVHSNALASLAMRSVKVATSGVDISD